MCQKHLKDEYIVLPMDFQGIGTEEFRDADAFSRAFARMCIQTFLNTEIENKTKLAAPIASLAEQEKAVVDRLCRNMRG